MGRHMAVGAASGREGCAAPPGLFAGRARSYRGRARDVQVLIQEGTQDPPILRAAQQEARSRISAAGEARVASQAATG